MLRIEPFDFSEDHYALMLMIDRAVFPKQPLSPEQWRRIDQTRDPALLFVRELIWRDDHLVAYGDYGQFPWVFHPQKVTFHVFVHPAHESPEIRPAYLAHVQAALAGRDLIALQNGMFSHWAAHQDFVRAHGFREVQREQLSELDLTTFDPAAFQPALDRVAAAGVRIVSLAEWQAGAPDWQRAMYDLDWVLLEDVPSAGEKTQMAFDKWCALCLDGPFYDAAGWFLALDGDRVVGLSRGCLNPEDATLFDNSLTGVLRAYRRQGIALALKVHLMRYAQSRGAQTVQTANEEHNPMYQLNLKLGFVPQPAWVTLEKSLAARGD